MSVYRLMSWNVNGIRAVSKKSIDAKGTTFTSFLQENDLDMLSIQETKAHTRDIPENLTHIPNYYVYFAQAAKKGYSGVALYTKHKPHTVQTGLGIAEFDVEGRTIIAEFDDFVLCTAYFPNGGASLDRLAYKLRFYEAFLAHVNKLADRGDNVIICGDVNTAHLPRDLSRPEANEHVSGFLPIERAWIDNLIGAGFVDTLRMFTKDTGHFTWWDYKTRSRERNVGWRLDYFFVNEAMKDCVRSASIATDILGSDHCPVTLDIEFP